ncbi:MULTISPECIES: phosphoribosyl-dephospho-CoA transferase MdcG domain-containing protein [Legionella]|uniref:Malonate decarboxylase holo-[acyl-carrier-protein] synthase n=1 Tax=Legionella resiliens TaxID=2905958 RepID=A0ABS8X4N6_9GAMM|nr:MULTISPECIES: phosphoribosyl-dephospho-CoA transferase MdcG domain-containing protein [unclassified Legionella]MCE0724587.1 malonate decarboxylase holo-[acyl-carrier-protein] synthase [Legionella sp. 9fVS26]MCE3533740.1 malonate decarboxylase holo-[acyl-carrier-protein] synthase [Legionella sp. 8cVS16]QLZ69935.1 Phosphoribosyl-dephospho-CoA transferase [Legionella sp. PC1000]
MSLQRHHLIYLQPDADFAVASIHEDKKMIEEHVSLWLAQGLPCIYAKQLAHQDTINLGLTLLHAKKKHRVSIQSAPSLVQKQKPLPQLLEMQDFFSSYYGIKKLDTLIKSLPISDIAVYGSFLFHYVSGYSFVDRASDLDLLISYQDCSLIDLRESIAALTKKFNRIIDGEVRFSCLGDIPIKELLLLSAKKLLCKSRDKVTLLSRAELYEHYPLL